MDEGGLRFPFSLDVKVNITILIPIIYLPYAQSFYASCAWNLVVMYEMLQYAQGGWRLSELLIFGPNPGSDCDWVNKKLCFYKV